MSTVRVATVRKARLTSGKLRFEEKSSCTTPNTRKSASSKEVGRELHEPPYILGESVPAGPGLEAGAIQGIDHREALKGDVVDICHGSCLAERTDACSVSSFAVHVDCPNVRPALIDRDTVISVDHSA